ncbi:MAG: peptidase S58 family protein [Acidobacteria bacterium]|nr:peptidase S58 family protein [Acidobacteriota bacterium]
MSTSSSRRTLLQSAAAAPLAASMATAPERSRVQPKGSITDVPGVEVGHWTSTRRPTGCTVVLTREGAVAGVDVRGGGPGTRETDLLRPERTIERAHAVVLSGGSAFGLATADGVMRYLEEIGVGFRAGATVVPIVPAAILYDLGLGDGSIRPTAESGYQAAKGASSQAVPQGSVGAGAGATVGKLLGAGRSMKSGLGSASLELPDGLVIGAVVAVNALGDVVDPETNEILAGALNEDENGFADVARRIREGLGLGAGGRLQNTTLGVVAANVDWTQAQATKVAQMAHDGLARTIRPVHMPFDGDTVFALGTGGLKVDTAKLGLLGALAADVLGHAVVAAVLQATTAEGRRARRDLFPDNE